MVPIVMENTLQLVAGAVLTAMVGRLLADDIAAQGISNMVYRIFFVLFRGLAIGATVMVAMYYGKRELSKCKRIIEQAYLSAIPMIVLAIIVLLVFPVQILGLFTDDGYLVYLAADFTRVLVWSLPFMAAISFNTAALNGQGDTKTPMLIAIVLNIVNIISGFVLIFGIGGIGGFGIMGAAYATVLAQFSGAALGFYALYRRKGLFRQVSHAKPFISLDKNEAKDYFSIGLPAAMEFMFWQFAAIVLGMVLLRYGTNYYAAYQLGVQAELLADMPAQGFIVAATTLAARAIAQEDAPLYRIYYSQLWKMALTVGIGTVIVLFTIPYQLMMLLTNNSELQTIGAGYLFMMGFAMIPATLGRVYGGFIRSSGGKRVPMYIAFVGIWMVRVPLVVLFGWVLELDISFVWTAIIADHLIRQVIHVIYTKRKKLHNFIETMEAGA